MSVQSIERAFSILEVVAAYPKGVGVTAVARQAALHKSTVSRLLATLEEVNAVERLPDGEGFCIGAGIFSLAGQQSFQRQLAIVARPFLLVLAEATGETVGLSVPDGDEVLYIDQVQSEHHIQVRDWTDTRFPLHVVCAGKLYLAHRSEEAVTRYLSRPLARYASKTLCDPAALRQRLAELRREGIDWGVDEFEDGLTSVAAPIMGETGSPVAALYVCGPSYRFPQHGERKSIAKMLMGVVAEIGERLQK